ncbi:TetR/AcrR family transcriptional regulator [Agrobacterium sp. ES01]|uniref:TetR/AcrR family transcriptional regulator n=1 Tax=Agrobacterium sp. ES01 TaxID=3420714 RepID=UPI003D0E487C
MASQKSISETEVKAKTPQRKRGRDRVAQLLEAGAAVFAERGYDAATMTEIAARAGAAIGSLYQFFPNKELLADALVERYGEHVFERLDEIEAQVTALTADQLTDVLLSVFRNLAAERQLALSLLDARWTGPSVRPGHFRSHIRARIAGILRLWNGELVETDAAIHAAVILQAMKADVQLTEEAPYPAKNSVVQAWRGILRDYLAKVKPDAAN